MKTAPRPRCYHHRNTQRMRRQRAIDIRLHRIARNTRPLPAKQTIRSAITAANPVPGAFPIVHGSAQSDIPAQPSELHIHLARNCHYFMSSAIIARISPARKLYKFHAVFSAMITFLSLRISSAMPESLHTYRGDNYSDTGGDKFRYGIECDNNITATATQRKKLVWQPSKSCSKRTFSQTNCTAAL